MTRLEHRFNCDDLTRDEKTQLVQAVLNFQHANARTWREVRPWWPYSYKACAGGFLLLKGPPA